MTTTLHNVLGVKVGSHVVLTEPYRPFGRDEAYWYGEVIELVGDLGCCLWMTTGQMSSGDAYQTPVDVRWDEVWMALDTAKDVIGEREFGARETHRGEKAVI